MGSRNEPAARAALSTATLFPFTGFRIALRIEEHEK